MKKKKKKKKFLLKAKGSGASQMSYPAPGATKMKIEFEKNKKEQKRKESNVDSAKRLWDAGTAMKRKEKELGEMTSASRSHPKETFLAGISIKKKTKRFPPSGCL